MRPSKNLNLGSFSCEYLHLPIRICGSFLLREASPWKPWHRCPHRRLHRLDLISSPGGFWIGRVDIRIDSLVAHNAATTGAGKLRVSWSSWYIEKIRLSRSHTNNFSYIFICTSLCLWIPIVGVPDFWDPIYLQPWKPPRGENLFKFSKNHTQR